MKMTPYGWGYLCDRSKEERKKEISVYADKYITPYFDQFPELYGKIYLAIRKEGFFAYPSPVLNIIIPLNSMINYSECHLKIITAHEMMHLIQYINNIGLSSWNVIIYERQATFMAFARGFGYDFLKAFSCSCKHESCDMKGRVCYFSCKHIFPVSCKNYSDDDLYKMANKLQDVSKQYSIIDFPDYIKIVRSVTLND